MRLTWADLTIISEAVDQGKILEEWQWLVSEEKQISLLSAIGDIFLKNEKGEMFWLDGGAGKLKKIANSIEEFDALRVKAENIEEWFMPQLVGDLIEKFGKLDLNQVFSYRKPPTLSGKYEVENFEKTDIYVHFSILGSIQKQIRSLPEGTIIDKFVTG